MYSVVVIRNLILAFLMTCLSLNGQNLKKNKSKNLSISSRQQFKELYKKSLSQAISLNLSEAYSGGNKLLESASIIGDDDYVAKANRVLGIVYHEIEEFDKSFYHYKIARTLAKKNRDTSLVVYVENDIGKNYEEYALLRENDIASFNLARKQYEKAIEMGRHFSNVESGHKIYPNYNLGTSNFHLGELYLRLGDVEKAKEEFQIAFSFLDKASEYLKNTNGFLLEKSKVLIYKGCIHAYWRDYKKANEFFDKALVLCRKTNNTSLINKLFKYQSKFRKENNEFKASALLIDSIIKYNKLEDRRFYEEIVASSSKVFDYNSAKIQLQDLKKIEEVKEADYKKIEKYNYVLVSLVLVLLTLGVLLYMKNKNLDKAQKLALKGFNHKIELERKIEKIENSIEEDLHDNFGNRINSLITAHDIIKEIRENKELESSEYDKFTKILEANLLPLSNDIKDLLWANNSSNNKLYPILKRISYISKDIMRFNNIQISLIINGKIREKQMLPKFANKQLLFIFKEALNNAIKYSKSEKFDLIVNVLSSKNVEIEMKDYGVGFDIDQQKRVNGLHNMRKRAELINFDFEIISSKNNGTIIYLKSKKPIGV